MKAILVIDMPNNCKECPFLDDSGDYGCCVAKDMLHSGYNFPLSEKRQQFCPLKPIPEKRFVNVTTVDNMVCLRKMISDTGFNTCIDEIMGEEE